MQNLQKIIDAKKLDKTELAKSLFPKNSHPVMALDRVLNGLVELSAEQYRVLSNLTEIPLGFLVSQDWLIGSEKPEEIYFLRGDVIVKLRTKDYITVIHQYKEGEYRPIYEVKAANVPAKLLLQDLIDLVISGNVTNLKSIK